MTTEQIAAGLELDAAVAEKVMGWARLDHGTYIDVPARLRPWRRADDRLGELPAFSTSWEGAGLVVERMRELGWEWVLDELYDGDADTPRQWRAYVAIYDGKNRNAAHIAPTAPEAICRAALAAVGSEHEA